MNTAINLNIIRSACYRLRLRSHVRLSGIQIACVYLSLVSTRVVTRDALWCGVENLKKYLRPVTSKTWFPKVSSGLRYYIPNNILPWKQYHVTTLLSSTNSVCSGRHVGHVRRSCIEISLLVMFCLVFIG